MMPLGTTESTPQNCGAQARYYHPDIGRFISEDPLGWRPGELMGRFREAPAAFNSYAYTINNPIILVDPDGERVEIIMRDLGNNSTLGIVASHSFIRITPDNPEDFGIEESFSFTLGGQDHGNLVGEINNADDVNTEALATENASAVVNTPEGMTDTQFINAILQNYDLYSENEVDYSVFSVGEGANCHDYASTMINWSGGEFPDINPSTIDPGLGGVINRPEGPLQENIWEEKYKEQIIRDQQTNGSGRPEGVEGPLKRDGTF